MSEQLKLLQAKCGAPVDGAWGPTTFKCATAYFKLTPFRAAHFFGNCAHETGNFTTFSENLNYGADALLRPWPTHFPTRAIAEAYAHQPVKIANRAYANRMGNGDEASGDGWRFRGRGAIQTTGKAAYQQVADVLNRPDVMENPDLLAGELAFDSAMVFFEHNGIWPMCDAGVDPITVRRVRKVLNGGLIGYDDVLDRVTTYYRWAA